MKTLFLFGSILILGYSTLSALSENPGGLDELATLKPNQPVRWFYAEAVYRTDDQGILGARFIHQKSGFVLDLLQIQSVPQAFIWVNSHPVSDRGEPHTLEHLLLGKGKKGRYVATLEEMSLGKSSAFTAQLRTCYHFHTTAGSSVFFSLFKAKLDAMLHPDFTDEEIRREVRNMGILVDAVDSTLALEEKGTVYNEMVSGFERPWGNLYFKLGKMLYGKDHPVGFSAGGLPDAIREMVPEHIRDFHASTHHLNNMGAVVTLPNDMNLDSCMIHLTQILDALEPGVEPLNIHIDSINDKLSLPVVGEEELLANTIFPHINESEPGVLVFAWPANRQLDTQNAMLLDLFLSNFAGGQTSILYDRFIDSENQIMDIGATSVYTWHSDRAGEPVYIGFNNVSREAGTEEMMDSIRQIILDEILKISEYKHDSDELNIFNQRIEGFVEENKKELADFLNSPPRFGYRGTGSQWMNHFTLLHKIGGFNRALSLSKYFDQALEIIKSPQNQWKNLIKKWKLLENKPHGIVTNPDPESLKKSDVDRDNRIHDFVNTLQKKYNTHDRQSTLRRFKEEYDKKTQIIEKDAQTIRMPEFIDNPPYSLDNSLNYSIQEIPGGGNLVFSNFDYLSGATLGFAFNLYAAPNSLLLYLPALPAFMRDIGVIKNGKNISYNSMQDRLRREILSLDVFFDTNERTNRVEMAVEVAGLNTDECREGLMWMKAILNTPYLHKDNLPRIRDVVDLKLGGLRNRMRRSEESWVMDPAQAFRKQNNPLFLTAGSFLTQKHALLRLRWQLKGSDKKTLAAFTKWMNETAQQAGNGRDNLITWLESPPQIPENIESLANEALHDLKIGLSDIPDKTLDRDWRYLCHIIIEDLAVRPVLVLENISLLLKTITHRDNMHSYIISSSKTYLDLEDDFFSLVAGFSDEQTVIQSYNALPSITQQMQTRYPHIIKPIFLGLVNNNSSSGVHINTASCASFMDSDPEILLDFLAARIYGGHGAHSMFMQTWGAGLAYSNGLRSNEYSGNLLYYAERCPDLTQTMQFVIQTLNRAPYDTALAEYAISQAFSVNRTGDRYEARGRSMAADLADGLRPEIVERFRKEIMNLRGQPDFYDKLYDRMEDIYGRVLPGYGPKGSDVRNALYFMIAPADMLKSYASYLKNIGESSELYLLYPRDYWIYYEN